MNILPSIPSFSSNLTAGVRKWMFTKNFLMSRWFGLERWEKYHFTAFCLACGCLYLVLCECLLKPIFCCLQLSRNFIIVDEAEKFVPYLEIAIFFISFLSYYFLLLLFGWNKRQSLSLVLIILQWEETIVGNGNFCYWFFCWYGKEAHL